MEEKKKKKVETTFRTKRDVVDYVKGMNTHILIWANSASNHLYFLKNYFKDNKKLEKDWGAKTAFAFIETNLKTVIDLIGRMEKTLKETK